MISSIVLYQCLKMHYKFIQILCKTSNISNAYSFSFQVKKNNAKSFSNAQFEFNGIFKQFVINQAALMAIPPLHRMIDRYDD